MKAQCCEKTSLKKGSWSPEEDQKLIDYIRRYGIWNWSEMPKFAGLLRSGKSCRLRWKNYLRPGINHGDFTQEEDETIIKLHQEFGNRWSKIASRIPGRTDNDIKNHWHSRLKKRLIKNNQVQETQTAYIVAPGASNPEGCKVISRPTSPRLCTNNFSSSGSDSAVTTEENNICSEMNQKFWEMPFTEEGLCLMDGFGATFIDPGLMVSISLSGLQDDISPSAFYGDDLWS